MSEDLTPDEPYVPAMSAEDIAEMQKLTRQPRGEPTDEKILSTSEWKQPGSANRDGESYTRIDAAFIARLAEIEAKLDGGLPLTDDEADYIINRTITGVLKTNRRPALRLKATQLLMQARIKQITTKTIDASSEKKDPPLALPG